MSEPLDNIIQRFNAGSERAFKEIFDRFFRSACSFVSYRVADPLTVENIVQETFIHVWEHSGSYLNALYFKAYLYKSLHNNALYYLRGRRSQEEIDLAIEDDTANALSSIINEEVYREINAAIEMLPPRRRKIIEMTLLGLTQEEIAGALHISINTLKTQKREALAFIRTKLKDLFVLFLTLFNL